MAFKYVEGAVGHREATHIDLPVDVAKMPVSDEEMPLKRDEFVPMEPKLSNTMHAAQLINEAKKPLILIGNNTSYYHNEHIIRSFATKLRIPATWTMMAKGIIPEDSHYAMMTIGIPDRDYVNLLFDEADIIICIGYDITELAPKKWNQKRNHKIIHIDNWPANVNKYYQCNVQLRGNNGHALQEILKYTMPKANANLAIKIKEQFLDSMKEASHSDAFPLKPQLILYDIRQALDSDDILISYVGAHKIWIGREYECYEPNTSIISNGFASMGIGVPGAIAAKLVYPNRHVLTVSDDGGFMMNSQELETAVRLHLNFVVAIFEDEHYSLIKWKEEAQYGKAASVSFTNPDFVALAKAMRCEGTRIEKAEDLIPAIKKGFTYDVPVNYSENMKLTNALKQLPQDL